MRAAEKPRRLPWHRRVSLRILAVAMIAIVAIEVVILVPMTSHYRDETRREFFDSAAADAWHIGPRVDDALRRNSRTLPSMEDLGGSPGTLVAVFNDSGALMAAHAGLPHAALNTVVREALAEEPLQLREGELEGRCYVLVPRADGAGVLALIKPAAGLARKTVAYVLRVLGLVLLICLFTASAMFFFLYREVVTPIDRIVSANLASADAPEDATRIDESEIPRNELGEIMKTRNAMLDRVKAARQQVLDSNAELELLNRNLEQRVRERTQALELERERVAQSEKLAAIGRLAASVAHEINNPLGIIAASAEDMRRELAGTDGGALSPQVERGFTIVASQIKRCTAIIDSLLNFSRRTASRPTTIDLGSFLRKTLQLVAHRAEAERKELRIEPPEPPADLTVNEFQLQQALVNLLENALDAIAAGQSVTLGAAVHEAATSIWVRDEGSGISDDIRRRVFEPFFTTKEPGRGAGMGLAIAANFVRAEGGRIELDPPTRRGATFRIIIPVHPPREETS